LLYTGALRTPVMAMVKRVPLWGSWCPAAAEHFATAQDVHVLLGHLTPEQCTSPSADGRPVTPEFAAERLARIVCADIEMMNGVEIQAIARYISEKQLHQIAQAMAQVRSRSDLSNLVREWPVVTAGVGAFLAQKAAAQLGLECISLATILGDAASEVAPAAAVAILLAENLR
jgi:probable H4MPT-linked C1 transfer pathway protein